MNFSQDPEGKDGGSPERRIDPASRPRENGAGRPRQRKVRPKWDEEAAPDDIWPIHAPDTD